MSLFRTSAGSLARDLHVELVSCDTHLRLRYRGYGLTCCVTLDRRARSSALNPPMLFLTLRRILPSWLPCRISFPWRRLWPILVPAFSCTAGPSDLCWRHRTQPPPLPIRGCWVNETDPAGRVIGMAWFNSPAIISVAALPYRKKAGGRANIRHRPLVLASD